MHMIRAGILGVGFAGLQVVGVLLGLGAARADSGETTWTTYLYEGPNDHYNVVDEVPQSQTFEILKCENGWCQIAYDHRSGWVEADVVIHEHQDAVNPPAGVLAQPAASIEAHPKGPCFPVNIKGGNGGNAPTYMCQK